MAFVQQVQGGDAAPQEDAETQKQTQEDEERAKARSKLWTPPGT
jgi:hypothetical protein